MVYRKKEERTHGPGMPRWVTVLLAVAVLVAVVLVVALLTGGDHGPSRHLSGSDGAASHLVPGTPAA